MGKVKYEEAIVVVNGQATYTMQVGCVNVAPESANHMLVSLNGILQKPGSSFTISGSTMTFASNLATGDSIDFVQILGNVLDLGQPSDDTVTAAKLNDNVISGQTAIVATPADTDELLISDAVTIKRIGFSHLKTGITEADQFRLTADLVATNGDITSNLERVDDASFEKIGTGMTNSSGIFSFPSTGLYQIITTANAYTSSQDNVYILTKVTINNSDYDDVAHVGLSVSNSYENTATMSNLVNVTNTSNVKVKFASDSFASGSGLQGDTNYNQTSFTFIRLGDSQ